MNIFPVDQNNFSQAVELLKNNHLPTHDITEATKLFALYNENEMTGVAGIELSGENALLRSLCVVQEKRTGGSGTELVGFIEKYAKNTGVKTIYLLTTTAASFFGKRAYQTIDRKEVPDAIRQTSEFSSVCPSSATVMKKTLA
jgi:amino-acid N-acetyltransferase